MSLPGFPLQIFLMFLRECLPKSMTIGLGSSLSIREDD